MERAIGLRTRARRAGQRLWPSTHLFEVLLQFLEKVGVNLLLVDLGVLELLQDELEPFVVDVVVLPPWRAVLLQVLAELHRRRPVERAAPRPARW
jgi:hypothetical protein